MDKVAKLLPTHPDFGIVKRRDTPASLTLPIPLVLDLGGPDCSDLGIFESLSSRAKIYEEGVMTVVVRAKAMAPIGRLHELMDAKVGSQGRAMSLSELAEEQFGRALEALTPAITEPRAAEALDRESYVAFCLLECDEDPAAFVERNREYFASLLIGEDPDTHLHESQMRATLASPFSYRDGDLAVFDMDRCLIVDPRRDYEDLLLIAEHANYQLLELRVLDKLLDSWLDEAEGDMRRISLGGSHPRRRMRRELAGARGRAAAKVAHIQAVRLDALFILENLENSSKIIGDYYLGQVYAKLCDIFNTEGWKWSVERRLDSLQNVYDMMKTDATERRMVALEVTFIVVCIVFPFLQILQVMIDKH